jgi:hypothetical protein
MSHAVIEARDEFNCIYNQFKTHAGMTLSYSFLNDKVTVKK